RRGSAKAWPPIWPVIQPSPSRGCVRSASRTCAPPGSGKGRSSSVDGGIAPRWTWASLMPGTMRRPCRSIRCVPGPASARIVASSPTAEMRPSSIASALADGRAGSPVQTSPLCSTRSVEDTGSAASSRTQASNRRMGRAPAGDTEAYATGARGRPAPRRPRLQPCALRGQGVALGRPVHQSRALLLDHGGRGVVDEAFAGQLGLRLRQLRLDALELLVQARAFGVEVDEAFEGYEQPKLADDAGGRGRRIAGQRLDALDAVEEPELRREAR